MTESIVLPAWTISHVPVRVFDLDRQRVVGLIEPVHSSKTDILTARCVCLASKQCLTVKLLNPSNQPMKLPKNTHIGNFSRLTNEQIIGHLAQPSSQNVVVDEHLCSPATNDSLGNKSPSVSSLSVCTQK